MRPRLLFLAALCLAFEVSAASPSAARKLVTWFPKSGPLTLRSGGVHVTIAPAPCRAGPTMTEGCRFDGVNNQASVSVTTPGAPPFRFLTNDQASYYRLGIVRIDRRDARPGVVVVDDSGGSGGLAWAHVLRPGPRGVERIDLRQRDDDTLIDVGEAVPTDMSGDGRVDFVVRDSRFGVTNGCNACRPHPPAVLTVRDGRSVDISADPAVRSVFVRDMAVVRRTCFSREPERNGACAAYVADAARAGRFATAWRDMLRHYDRASRDTIGAPGVGFPEALRAGLQWGGYPTR